MKKIDVCSYAAYLARVADRIVWFKTGSFPYTKSYFAVTFSDSFMINWTSPSSV